MLTNSSHRTKSMYVVFACSGNICCSPVAEVIVRDAVEANAFVDDVLLASYGIGGWHVGELADGWTQAELENVGYDPNHVAAQLGDEHMDATLFITMDESHINGLLRAGMPKGKIRLMCFFDPASSKGVVAADPYYRSPEGFVRTRNEIGVTTSGITVWPCETLALASER